MAQASSTQANDQAPEAIDPSHDIDGFKVATILLLSAATFCITMWLLFHLFAFVIADERQRKVGDAEAIELQQLEAAEDAELTGADGKKSIEQAIREISK